jgi:hypothetical protein
LQAHVLAMLAWAVAAAQLRPSSCPQHRHYPLVWEASLRRWAKAGVVPLEVELHCYRPGQQQPRRLAPLPLLMLMVWMQV